MTKDARNVWEICLVTSSFNTTSVLSSMIEFCTGFLPPSFLVQLMNHSTRRSNTCESKWALRRDQNFSRWRFRWFVRRLKLKCLRSIISTYGWSLCRLCCCHRMTPCWFCRRSLFLLFFSLLLLLFLPLVGLICLEWLECFEHLPLFPEPALFLDEDPLPLFSKLPLFAEVPDFLEVQCARGVSREDVVITVVLKNSWRGNILCLVAWIYKLVGFWLGIYGCLFWLLRWVGFISD